jgi:drug/metabolite transporter (DMT)-like permease
VIWAIAVILFRKSGERLSPLALNLFKNTIGLGLFLITMPLMGATLFSAEHSLTDWLVLLASGIIGIGIADTLFFASLNRLGAANSAVVDCLYSPFVVIGAFFYLHESISARVLIAVALMVGAILVGTWEPGRTSLHSAKSKLATGIALGVVSMVLMAVGVVIAKPVLSGSSAWWVTTVRLIGGTGVLTIQALLSKRRGEVFRTFMPGPQWKVALPAAVIGAYIAMITWILGMKYAQASNASVFNQMSTIFVLILAAIFLGEKLTARRVAAIAMAFAGAILAAH